MNLSQLPLDTRSLHIRPFVSGDSGDVFALSNEATLRAWLPNQVYKDESHARAVLKFLMDHYSTSTANPRYGPYVLAIEHRADRALIGHIGLSPIDDDVEIGFAIARQGLATEAIIAVSRWALATFALDRILGITSVANVAAKRTLERTQFAYQGDYVMTFQGVRQSVSRYVLSACSGKLASSMQAILDSDTEVRSHD